MPKSEKCKIVQDLLPNYIEKLTSDETNEYIERHLTECNECKGILRDMGEDIILDKIDDKKKLDYLKKIKYKNRLIVGIILTIATILIIIVISFFTSIGGVAIDENGNPEYYEAFKKWITGQDKITTSDVTNLLITSNEDKIKIIMIISFNKKDICIGARYCIEGYENEELLERYDNFKRAETRPIPMISNVIMCEDKIIFNYNYWNTKNKDDVLEELKQGYESFTIEEM
jgi:hypothetical protein